MRRTEAAGVGFEQGQHQQGPKDQGGALRVTEGGGGTHTGGGNLGGDATDCAGADVTHLMHVLTQRS